MRLLLPILAAGALVTLTVITPQGIGKLVLHDVFAQQGNLPPPNPNCQPFGTVAPDGLPNPVPSYEPGLPIWCYPISAATSTSVRGANDWVDTYDNNGPALQSLDASAYNVWLDNSGGRIAMGAFVNDDHWAFDMGDASQYRLSGGAQLSPNRSFRFENGRLVIEGDIAAGSSALGGADAFSEMDITPAPRPTGVITDELYGYGEFGGVGALGCRFERAADGPHIVCAMYDDTGRTVGQGGRLWETQGTGTNNVAAEVIGGYPQWPIPGTNITVNQVWRICTTGVEYDACLDRFRMELTKDTIRVYVNGFLVMAINGLFAVNPATGRDNRIPDAWLGPNGVYAYYTSWINGGIHHTIRFYWDRVAVNPHDASGNILPPSASPTFTGPVIPPTATPFASRTATPTGSPSPTPTPPPTATLPPADPPQSGGGGHPGGGGGSKSPPPPPAPAVILSGGGGGGGGGGLAFLPVVPTDTPLPTPLPTATPTATPEPTSWLVELPATGGDVGVGKLGLLISASADALGGQPLSIAVDTSASNALPPAAPGMTFGERLFSMTGTPASLAAPLRLLYYPSATEQQQATGDAARLALALWTDAGWAPLPCAIDRATPLLACTASQLGQFAVLVTAGSGSQLDLELANGHFYKQANGYRGAGIGGFSVTDDDSAMLWSEFQRLGGVDELGYPVSDRFLYRGAITQAFQRAALQWDAASGSAARVNLFDELSQHGSDGWLLGTYQVPIGPAPVSSPFDEEVVAAHLGLLESYPALLAFFDADPGALERYGLPLAVRDYGELVTVRLQRGLLQLWTVDKPWAAAGTVIVGNAGDVAKEAGLWPAYALAPRPAPVLTGGQP